MTTAIETRRTARRIVGAYLTLSLLTVVTLAVLSAVAPSRVTPEAWVRGVIVAVTSVLTFLFATRAVSGDERALLRLRIVVAIPLVAFVAVLFFLPLPGWMIGEQATCGALLLATAALIFRPAPTA
ncbi:hypothetical protein [Yinghuangia seranimata]|uniref:hypothetical protein n=1 Tax=Yinghuangia seranimata TaxID=408067 RepID=UPI00248BA348|nr:hypothetical protein [Yinghuangia seranimata]MDI2127822.1 hypothetical protein [Yinghuangia seranimata]